MSGTACASSSSAALLASLFHMVFPIVCSVVVLSNLMGTPFEHRIKSTRSECVLIAIKSVGDRQTRNEIDSRYVPTDSIASIELLVSQSFPMTGTGKCMCCVCAVALQCYNAQVGIALSE